MEEVTKEVSLKKRIQDKAMGPPSIRRLGKEKDPAKNTKQEWLWVKQENQENDVLEVKVQYFKEEGVVCCVRC